MEFAAIKLSKEQASDLVQGMRPHLPFPSDWAITDEEITLLENTLNKVQEDVGYQLDKEDMEAIAGELGRHDSKTFRMMLKGFVIEDSHFFIEEADAVEWFNNNGITCTTFDEGVEQSEELERPLAGFTLWTQWFDGAYWYCGL